MKFALDTALYILYPSKQNEPAFKLLSIRTQSMCMLMDLKECIENAFQCIGIVALYQHLENLIVGGASIKLVLHSDLGV